MTMTFVRTLIAAAGLAVAANAAFAADFDDREHKFRVSVPDGWLSQAKPTETVHVVLLSPRLTTTGGNCPIMSQAVGETEGLSQSDLDKKLAGQVNETFWQLMFTAAGFPDAKVVATDEKKQDGRKIYNSVVKIVRATAQGTVEIRAKQTLYALPGALYMVNCTAREAGFETETEDFESIFKSMKPDNRDYVASLRTHETSGVTLVANGPAAQTRTVTENAPNLPLSGWWMPTARVALTGAEAWQVCDGINYTGQCGVIAASTAFENGGAKIASLRRVAVGNDSLAARATTFGAALTPALNAR